MSTPPTPSKNQPQPRKIAPPKGTRDFYPEDLLASRYITNAWRDASIRCGFDEIAGPTFESTELYSVKSGEGILGELFQAFSGKSEGEIEEVQQTGRAPYALRPEFTPTLARMYAAHAKQLPKPCKWFTAGPYFRAERPQRGRLREFLQWNVDAIGLPGEDATPETKFRMDSEVIECALRMFESLGLDSESVAIHMNDRSLVEKILNSTVKAGADLDPVYAVLDKRNKISPDAFESLANEVGLDLTNFDQKINQIENTTNLLFQGIAQGGGKSTQDILESIHSNPTYPNAQMVRLLRRLGFADWARYDASVVRGLAYYTGTVFEAIADGERAVAGGGRYDNLIELFGGPPTPACGFGMGDVVLGNLLVDKGLMPTGAELMEAVGRPQASIRPDAFVVPNGDEDNEALVHTLTANLRRGIENEAWLARDDRKPWQDDRYRVAPLHARTSYKSTRNLKKLRADAEKQHARYFVEIHAPDKVELTDMDRRESLTSDTLGSFSVDPAAPNYVGAAITARI